MKELVSIHEFLVLPDDLSDWHQDSELAADNYNVAIHLLYEQVEDDIETEKLSSLLEQVWYALAADEYLTEFDDENEIMVWVEQFLSQQES